MRTIYSAITAILLSLLASNTFAQVFYTTPGYYTYIVPASVTSISFDVQGAAGGQSNLTTNDGGGGARVQGNLAVTPGQTLHIYVGGRGTNGSSGPIANPGGYNGGGNGYREGGGGGGSSDIRLTYSAVGTYTTSNRVVVAAGGGGGGFSSGTPGNERGGGGGTLTGESGYNLGATTSSLCPTGGTPTAGGTNGGSCGGGTTATLGEGADASMSVSLGAGGGGGYYGGGWGCYAGGAGGSSYAGPGTSAVAHTRGYNPGPTTSTGNGIVILCTGTAGTITGNGPVCIGYTRTLSAGFSGGVWTSGSTGIATVGSSGMVTGIASGTATITYTATIAGCGTAYSTVVVTVNPVPTAITGPSTVCATQAVTLSNTVPGGAWTSSNTSRATANSTSGVITGVSAGTATISYSFGSACYVTKPITVSALSAIAGLSSLCTGLTTTLTNGTGGGTWSSSNTAVATIGSTGSVTALAVGTTTISYALPSGCTATRSFTVVSTPPAISGSNNMCVSSTTTLTNVGGGTWTSSAPGIASIGSSSGIVTGAAAGTATITYSLGAGCYATMPFTVNAFPTAIAGSPFVCEAASATFTSSGSGTWSTTDVIITLGSTSGTVTGLTTGSASITYTSSAGCAVTKALTVRPIPGVISGTLSACPAVMTTLSCTPTGGTWTSASTAIAIVTSSGGVVNPVAAGVVNITYTDPATTCYRIAQFTVNPNPSPITGSSTVCLGDSTTLSSAPSGGTWSAYPSTIGSISGVVIGVWASTSAGVSSIVYTLPTGCRAAFSLTVNLPPAAGTFSVPLTDPCPGDVFTLTASLPGGIWSSTNTTLATIGATSGIVNVLASGWDTIRYSRTNLCGITTHQRTLVIQPAPDPGTISGPGSVCVGKSVTMSNTVITGTWSTATGKAAITSAGLLSGAYAGIDTIKYTATNSCGSAVATKVITVNPNPTVDFISGPNTICEGETMVLSNTTIGGVWSASNGNATVDASGNVTGVTSGTVAISYSVTDICTTSAVHSITVISYADCHAGVRSLSSTGYKVYPNPSDGSFSIELPQPMAGTITITDVLGKTVERRVIERTNALVHSFNVAAKGNYFIALTTGDNSYHSKVTIR